MSAESPRKSNRQGGYVVAPQPVTDRSIIESVAGFINEVVPQGYSGPGVDGKEVITWARFEQADINDPSLYPDSVDEPTRAPPLLLVLGYANGVQVWAVPASGEATEVLSWRQGVVRTLRVLPSPPTGDSYAHKRPLVALCDTASPGPQFCSLSFISLRAGDQVKNIKFKNPVTAVLANVRCVVVTFLERIAVFDACTLEDRLTVTTCYPSPGIDINPVALGARWMAYAERRLLPAKRCSGGTEGEGIQSYTATVLHAAKSLSKGLRELGETVASSLTGAASPPGVRPMGGSADGDLLNPGIVTILDVKGTVKDNGRIEETVVAHFAAHGDAVVAMQFDPSGMLLATADKRGHDFHVFRIQPHPGGSSLAAVHHLYVLHRGDTTAKVQDLVFAWDSRWLAVSTLRGTTHVFPVTPYGGAVGLRTHSSPHVVNRLSRFHRSAGLSADGRNSPIPCEGIGCGPHNPAMAHANPRLPPYPHPTVVMPLAQIRQSQPTPAPPPGRSPGTRRSHAPDEAGTTPLRVSACFGAPRAWLVGSPTAPRDSSSKARRRAVDSLFVMACHGNLIQYDLETKHASGTPREKVCDDTPIEMEVQAKAQWTLGGLLRTGAEVQPPLSPSSLLIAPPPQGPPIAADGSDERWLSQVEIVTHAGPHRRLWMGPQFTFKTYTQPSVGPTADPEGPGSRLVRSNPVNMPLPPVLPVLIESGSGSSYEQSPRLLEACGRSTDGSDGSGGPGDVRLREDLAEAMQESSGIANRDTGHRVIVEICSVKRSQAMTVEKIVNPVGSVLTVLTEEGLVEGSVGDAESVGAAIRWPTDVMKTVSSLSPPSGGSREASKLQIQRIECKLDEEPTSIATLTQVDGQTRAANGQNKLKKECMSASVAQVLAAKTKEVFQHQEIPMSISTLAQIASQTNEGIGQNKLKKDSLSGNTARKSPPKKEIVPHPENPASVETLAQVAGQSKLKKDCISSSTKNEQQEIATERHERNLSKKKSASKEKSENCIEVCNDSQSVPVRMSPPKIDLRLAVKKPRDCQITTTVMPGNSREDIKEQNEKIACNHPVKYEVSMSPQQGLSLSDNHEGQDVLAQPATKNSTVRTPSTRKTTKKQLCNLKSRRFSGLVTDQELPASEIDAPFQGADPEECKVQTEEPSCWLATAVSSPKKDSTDSLVTGTSECFTSTEDILDLPCSNLQTDISFDRSASEATKLDSPKPKSAIETKAYSEDKFYNKDRKSTPPFKSKSSLATDGDVEWGSTIFDEITTEPNGNQSNQEPVVLQQTEDETDAGLARARKYPSVHLDDAEDTAGFRRRSPRENVPKGGSKKKLKLYENSDEKSEGTGKSRVELTADEYPALEVSRRIEDPSLPETFPASLAVTGEASLTDDESTHEVVATWSSIAAGKKESRQPCQVEGESMDRQQAEEDDETPVSVQANKKSRRIKKKRR